jgi:hypothetical protein
VQSEPLHGPTYIHTNTELTIQGYYLHKRKSIKQFYSSQIYIITFTLHWHLELDPRSSDNCGIVVESMCISLSHVDHYLITYRKHATSDLHLLTIITSIHKIYDTKNIFQNSIYTNYITHTAFQHNFLHRTSR